jgi:hypothetical protein
MKWVSKDGTTYFSSKGFSINESRFPNICLRWDGGLFFYIAFSHRLKWWFNSKARHA